MTGTQILRIRTKFTAFPVSPARKLSGCDPHFRPSYGVARCADLRGPRAAGGNSVWCSRICQFCAPGYSVGRARAEFAERIRKSHRIREHSEFTAHLSPIRILKQACSRLEVALLVEMLGTSYMYTYARAPHVLNLQAPAAK